MRLRGSVSCVLLLLAGACSSSGSTPVPVDAAAPCHPEEAPLAAPTRVVPRWAFSPWISKDISTGPDTYAFVDGFRERDIPVGAVVLDSPWETHYNTFVPNPKRYPEFPKMVTDMHGRGVRVVLWITSMVNSTGLDFEPGGDTYVGASPNFAEGERCGYFVNDADQYFWWKGRGAAVDFFNARARTWWHGQQDGVLGAGIDGWKLDFGESYVKKDVLTTAQGEVPHQAYSEKYYEDFLAYGQAKRGKDFVTMVRGWDESYDFKGRFFAKKEHAPIAWMGDNRRDWVGLIDALQEMFVSAKAGYQVMGSDIGGYLDHDDKNLTGPEIPFDPVNFAKWTATSAMTPFMQLHGRGNFAPWTVPARAEEVVVSYKYWAKLHQALVPFFVSTQAAALAGGAPMVQPVGDEGAWSGDYRYHLGGAFLVAPLLDGTGARNVTLPPGRYYDFYDHRALDGGSTVSFTDGGDIGKIPLFVREGAIVPLDVVDAANALGDERSKGALTVLAYPGATLSRFTLREEDDAAVELTAQATVAESTLTVAPSRRAVRARIRSEVVPTAVAIDGASATLFPTREAWSAAPEGAYYDVAAKAVWVSAAAGKGRIVVTR
ncbi:MAG: glycoside hydrolase family 31 protein [Polyangiaceae bacterium]|nr:glycoside hydrolase family 31 protein [Polyangiaceae bacterium]